ncbi:MAG: glycosyltransferase [Balneolaceae bacterium]
MARKKVLIITYYWPPSGGSGVQRWVKFCKYLPEFNVEPIILTVENGTYPLVDNSLLDQVNTGLQVYYSKSIEPYSIFAKLMGKSSKEVSTPSTSFSTEGGLIQKLGVWIRSNFFIPDARIGWIPNTFSKAKDIIEAESIDTLITTGPPNSTHITGTKLKTWKPELKWIMDMRDPWSQIFYNENLPRTTLAKKIDLNRERKALQSADEVIVVSDSMAKLQSSIFHRNFSIISNGFDHEELPEQDEKAEKENFVIKYIGTMTESAIPHNFFKAVTDLPNEYKSKIKLEFFGSYSQKIHAAIEQYQLSEVADFKGYVPHIQAKQEMAKADLLLMVIPNTKNNKLILTGKLFDYIAAQKPIFYIGPESGDAAKIINEYGLGICFNYRKVQKISSLIKESIDGSKLNYHTWEKDFKDHPFSRYSLTKKLAKIIS